MHQVLPVEKASGYIKNSTLLVIAFATAFFPRVLDSVGFPSAVNFVHFITVPLACGIVLLQSKTRDRNQILISRSLLVGLTVLLGVTIASALMNNAGVINAILDFLLLAEPFILLVAMVYTPLSLSSLAELRGWIVKLTCFHIFLALAQKVLLDVGVLHATKMSVFADNIQGVFYLSGSGHVVGASVSISFGIYYLLNKEKAPLWLRVFILSAAFLQVLVADAKQVLLVCLVSAGILILVNVKDIKKTLQYLLAASLFSSAFLWCMQNLAIFRAFNTWIRPEIYGPKGEATVLKTVSFRIITAHQTSPFDGFLGLGPGHTVGRLGGWMLDSYWDLLGPLGATVRPVSKEVWDAVYSSWLGPSSSMFSPFFGWIAIWGDLGFLGLGAYLYLASIVWRRLCIDDFSKFLVLNVLVNGFIFTQMEEPGYMLSVASLIGLQWHEKRSIVRSNRSMYSA